MEFIAPVRFAVRISNLSSDKGAVITMMHICLRVIVTTAEMIKSETI